jgi:hypothetical protein
MTRPVAVVLAAAAGVIAIGAQSFAAGDAGSAARTAKMGMEMVGNTKPYPDLERAGARNVRRARHLLHASRRSSHRFNTIAKAKRLGYVIRRWIRPGFTHARKNATVFWGRLFDADAPQALVFWCPSHGRCTLTTYMYRAPAGRPPSTWRKLLQWHRHDDTESATWMTHVWLVKSVRKGFATCAPMAALVAELGIHQEPYKAIHPDKPCDRPRHGDHDEQMPGMQTR